MDALAVPPADQRPGWPRLWPEAGGRWPGWRVDLGRREYAPIWALQRALVLDRRAGALPDTLLLVEHPPTITIGRGGTRDHLLASAAHLAAMGATVLEVDRGGDITYHGPGQLVAYPLVDLLARGRDIHRYLRLLEEAVIRALAEFGLGAHRSAPHTGVWLGDEKIAAIGVKVSRGVTLHGLALNVAPDLDHFAAIVPCGIRDKGVTSMARRLGQAPPRAAVAERLAHHLGDLLGVAWSARDLTAAPAALLHALILGAPARTSGPVIGSEEGELPGRPLGA